MYLFLDLECSENDLTQWSQIISNNGKNRDTDVVQHNVDIGGVIGEVCSCGRVAFESFYWFDVRGRLGGGLRVRSKRASMSL